jgi:hypothetical protein
MDKGREYVGILVSIFVQKRGGREVKYVRYYKEKEESLSVI